MQNALAEVWDHHADTVPRTKRNLVPGYSELSTRTGVRSERIEATTPVTKLKLAWARFGGQRFGLVLR